MNTKLYLKPDEFYKALCQCIGKAEHSIDLLYLAYVDGYWANQIGNLLMKKSKQGCRIRICIDLLGTVCEDITAFFQTMAHINKLKHAGIDVIFYTGHGRLLQHQHMKLCCVDQKYFCFGGSNIADHYTTWEDTNAIYTGKPFDCFASLSDIIIAENKNDIQTLRALLEEHQPKLNSLNPQLYLHVPGYVNDIKQALLHVISDAKKYLYIQTWYLAPDAEIVERLVDAKQRGVDVRILISHKNGIPLFSTYYKPLHTYLKRQGIYIYAWTPSCRHTKVYMNDQQHVLIGSANLDHYSFHTNTELLVGLHDRSIHNQLQRQFLTIIRSKNVISNR